MFSLLILIIANVIFYLFYLYVEPVYPRVSNKPIQITSCEINIVKMAPKKEEMPFTWRRGEKGYQIEFFPGRSANTNSCPSPFWNAPGQLFLKYFLEEHTLESSGNRVEQRYTHCTIDKACKRDVFLYIPGSPLAKKSYSLYV